jgi:hypothetical protein
MSTEQKTEMEQPDGCLFKFNPDLFKMVFGAQGFGPAMVFPYLTMKDAGQLMLVSRQLSPIVKAFPWHDMTTRVKELVLWRRCFPNATACLVSGQARIEESISSWFEVNPFEGIKWIKFLRNRGHWWCTSKFVSLFANAETLHIDEVQDCHVEDVCKVDPCCLLRVRDLTIKCDLTDEHLKHLAQTGVHKLEVSGYNFSFTDERLKRLNKVKSLSLKRLDDLSMVPPDPSAVLTDAALAGLQSLTYLCLDWVPCTFTASGFAALPLRVLQLAQVDGITIPAGALGKHLPNIECLDIYMCDITLADKDIQEMKYLTQLVLKDCPAEITASGFAALPLRVLQLAQVDGITIPAGALGKHLPYIECLYIYRCDITLADKDIKEMRYLIQLVLNDCPAVFTASGFAALPLRMLQLVQVDGITIPAGALGKYLPYIECLRIDGCNIALADEDIQEMRYLSQLVLNDCPAVITSSALSALVYHQVEFGQGVMGPGCHLKPRQFDWKCIIHCWYDITESEEGWPVSLYNRDNRDQIIGLRQAIHQARCNHKGPPQSGLNLPYLTQVSIQHCPEVVFTLEHYNALIKLVPYVSFEPSHLVGNAGWVGHRYDEYVYSMDHYPGWDEDGDQTP